MNFEKEILMFRWLGKNLESANYDEMEIKDIIAFVLSVETQLFRARINIEHKLNQK